jgi:ATP adenylyltransferase
MKKRNLFVPNKLDYTRHQQSSETDCILCAIVRGEPQVTNLVVGRLEGFLASLNLYPYNPGHLIVFPERHLLDIRELSDREILDCFSLVKICMEVLDKLYQPQGYNLGCNIGAVSGASITHLHQHVVPRYPRELGLIDIIGGARVIVEDPTTTREKLISAFQERGLKP